MRLATSILLVVCAAALIVNLMMMRETCRLTMPAIERYHKDHPYRDLFPVSETVCWIALSLSNNVER
jgi:hypothetical protein